MNKWILSILLTLLTTPIFAASGTYKIVAFYNSNGFVTERFIPFKVQDSKGVNVDKIISVTLSTPGCYSMVDPFRSHIFHVYCQAESNVNFLIKYMVGEEAGSIVSPDIHVKKLAIVSSTPTDPGVTDVNKWARKEFTNKCTTCHTERIKAGVTATIITKAFTGQAMRGGNKTNDMLRFTDNKGKVNAFTTAELNAIAKYINEEYSK